MPASFPDSPAFNESFIPAPPKYMSEEMTTEEYISKLDSFLNGQYVGLRTLQNSIASGWLISTLRVLDLDANTITAGTIFTQDLYVGTDGNGGIRLGGTDSQIEITDDSGTTRFLAGNIGSGNWFQISNSSGTVILQSGTTTFIDGVILKNASVADGAITDLAGNKLTGTGFIGENEIAASAVTAGKINVSTLSAISANVGTLTAGTINATVAINAGAINAGTLTVDGSPAISVTGSGACVFQSGGDIIMKSSGSGDDNLIELQTSLSSRRGVLGYNSTNDVTYLTAYNGADLSLTATGGGDIKIAAAAAGNLTLGNTSNPITYSGRAVSDFLPNVDDMYDLGSSSLKWADIYTVLVGGMDFVYDNDWRRTEPDHVWTWADRYDGIVTMNEKWEPVEWLHRDGSRQIDGFKVPDIPRIERDRNNK